MYVVRKVGRPGLVLGLASQASRVYLRGVPIHTATGVASRVYSISHFRNVLSVILYFLHETKPKDQLRFVRCTVSNINIIFGLFNHEIIVI